MKNMTMTLKSEHPDTINGYSQQEERARERYYENRVLLSIDDLTRIKQAAKEGCLEALAEYAQYKKSLNSRKDPDLISTTEAYNLRGRARVQELINRGLLARVSSGNASNSPRYVSKKKLFALDHTYLQ